MLGHMPQMRGRGSLHRARAHEAPETGQGGGDSRAGHHAHGMQRILMRQRQGGL